MMLLTTLLYSMLGGSGGLVAPLGYVFLIDSNGAYLIDSNGAYLIGAI